MTIIINELCFNLIHLNNHVYNFTKRIRNKINFNKNYNNDKQQNSILYVSLKYKSTFLKNLVSIKNKFSTLEHCPNIKHFKRFFLILY